MDQIIIKDLEVYGHHGVYKEENILGQKFLISANLYGDLSPASRTDDINESVNYGEACHFIKAETEKKTFKLIESLTEHLAKGILLSYPSIQKVRIEVKKPWAPILLPIDTVSIIMERMWHKVFLSIGSNLGDKVKNLNTAIDRINEDELSTVVKVSPFIETEPVGGVEQDDFLNGALEIKTLRTPNELLELIKEIETKLKRVRTIHWGPRTIDIDILFYDDLVIETKDLRIPHVELGNRMFVLEPMLQIASYMKHPIFNKTIYELHQEQSKKRD